MHPISTTTPDISNQLPYKPYRSKPGPQPQVQPQAQPQVQASSTSTPGSAHLVISLDSSRLDSTQLDSTQPNSIQLNSTQPNLSDLKPYSWIAFIQDLLSHQDVCPLSTSLVKEEEEEVTPVKPLRHGSPMLVLVVGHQSLSILALCVPSLGTSLLGYNNKNNNNNVIVFLLLSWATVFFLHFFFFYFLLLISLQKYISFFFFFKN